MTHVSRRRLKPNQQEKLINTLRFVLQKINNGDDMNVFLHSLLSDTETTMLAKRLAAIVLIHEGVSEKDISEKLNITRETVLRIKMQMKIRGNGYKVALNKLAQEKILKDFKKFLLTLGSYSINAAGGYIKTKR